MDAELRLRGELREAELRLDGRIEAAKAEVIKWMFGTVGFRRSLFSARSLPSCVW